MKKIIIMLMLTISAFCSFHANAQIYDLVRSVNTFGPYLQDTMAKDYTQTGTLEIYGKTIRRISQICQYGTCLNQDIHDEILAIAPVTGYRALVSGDSGDLVTITILSTHPTIIIMESSTTGRVSIEEYRPR